MVPLSREILSVHERALKLALEEILSQRKHVGVIPSAPDYKTVIQRAAEIERVLTGREHSHHSRPVKE